MQELQIPASASRSMEPRTLPSPVVQVRTLLRSCSATASLSSVEILPHDAGEPLGERFGPVVRARWARVAVHRIEPGHPLVVVAQPATGRQPWHRSSRWRRSRCGSHHRPPAGVRPVRYAELPGGRCDRTSCRRSRTHRTRTLRNRRPPAHPYGPPTPWCSRAGTGRHGLHRSHHFQHVVTIGGGRIEPRSWGSQDLQRLGSLGDPPGPVRWGVECRFADEHASILRRGCDRVGSAAPGRARTPESSMSSGYNAIVELPAGRHTVVSLFRSLEDDTVTSVTYDLNVAG